MVSNPLHKLMNPGSLAVIGASNNPMKMGTIQYLSILRSGFVGDIFVIHPKDQMVFGRKAYKSPHDLPYAPDCVMFVLPSKFVPEYLTAFGEIGTKRAIIITAGFREIGNEGPKLEEKIKEIAVRFGIRFTGPNSMGIINTYLPLNTTVLPVLDPPGHLGFASQSGTYVTQSLVYLNKRGIKFSQAISLGNEANIDIVDAIQYLGQDPNTKAISLYIEGIKRGDEFLRVAKEVSKEKPIIAQYVGGTKAGAKAGASHTGAMAGPDYLYEGLFKSAGIIIAQSVEELYDYGHVLANSPRLKGNKIAILSNSGGPGTAMANTLEKNGLVIPEFSEQLQENIKKYIPAHGSAKNPIDLTFHLDTSALTEKIPRLLFESDEVDGVLTHGIMDTGFMKVMIPHFQQFVDIPGEQLINMVKADTSKLAQMPVEYLKPLLCSAFFDKDDHAVKTLIDNNVPTFTAPEKTAKGMAILYQYMLNYNRLLLESEETSEQAINSKEEIESILSQAKNSGSASLDEHTSKKILSLLDLPVSRESLAKTIDEAVSIAADFGYPVVLKACSENIQHKTGKGLIQLNLTDENEVKQGFDSIRKAYPEGEMLVQKMIKGDRELMAGIARLAGFNPFVMFGLGGVFAEAILDRTFRSAPLNKTLAENMIMDIRSSKILTDFRGKGKVNLEKLAYILIQLGNLALKFPQIKEIDLNPIIISQGEPVIVDALFILGE